ncbi:MAG: hypothetical protein Q7T11_09420, partial [Deltaproteobacteria bacterium]|nr:hypothetical protein [Deltaproteobacteria bacterium]
PGRKWGNAIHLHVDDYETVEATLNEKKGESFKYEGREGYKQFTRDYVRFTSGDMQKAYVLASAILGEEFPGRKWGNQVPLHVADYDSVQTALESGKYQGMGGMKDFRADYMPGRTLQTVWHTASSILGYDNLEWREKIGWSGLPEVKQMDREAGRQRQKTERQKKLSASRGVLVLPFHPLRWAEKVRGLVAAGFNRQSVYPLLSPAAATLSLAEEPPKKPPAKIHHTGGFLKGLNIFRSSHRPGRASPFSRIAAR